MDFLFKLGSPETITRECKASSIGKKLPEDLYVHRSVVDQLPALLRLLTFAARQVVGEIEHDIIKLSMHGRSVSFLKYRSFEEAAHPELEYSVRVFLPTATYTVRHYSNSVNPPILHRKESFIDVLHPRYSEFAALTAREDELGLLSRSDIGTRKSWLAILSERGLRIQGHTVLPL
jgi:DNA phosphorothioation-associated putative methyltransferase